MLEPDYKRLWMYLRLSGVDFSLNAMGSQNDMINKVLRDITQTHWR